MAILRKRGYKGNFFKENGSIEKYYRNVEKEYTSRMHARKDETEWLNGVFKLC